LSFSVQRDEGDGPGMDDDLQLGGKSGGQTDPVAAYVEGSSVVDRFRM
jgi:hypothetical protein